MDIFALRGAGNTGKSTTIGLLHSIFIQNGYRVIDTTFNQQGADFRTIFSKKNKLIGITSSGDTYDLVFDNLSILTAANCVICVCACRTYDRYGHGTNAAIDSFQNYQKHYLNKNVSSVPAQWPIVNQTDAQMIFNAVNALV